MLEKVKERIEEFLEKHGEDNIIVVFEDFEVTICHTYFDTPTYEEDDVFELSRAEIKELKDYCKSNGIEIG